MNVHNSITATGLDSEGISVTGDNGVITIKDAITTADNLSEGISVIGDNVTVLLQGSIMTEGNDSPGVVLLGLNNTLNVSGDIQSSQSTAVNFFNTDPGSSNLLIVEALDPQNNAAIIQGEQFAVKMGDGSDTIRLGNRAGITRERTLRDVRLR